MPDTLSYIGEFAAALLAGGVFEIVVLIVLIVLALAVLLIALWVLWKVLVLLGKGLVWLLRAGSDTARKRTAGKRAARLAAPPPVTTGWNPSPRIRLRRALAEARRLAGSDALCILVVAGDGGGDLCRSLGLNPPADGAVAIAAGDGAMLIDATGADARTLRSLAGSLPWRRPVDGVAAIVVGDGIPGDALVRAATFARAAGSRVALHFVLATGATAAAWRVVDAANRDGAELCAQLAQDAARNWLGGGPREGLRELSIAQSSGLSTALARALAAAPSSSVDVASVSLGGHGLRSAVARTVARTRPAQTPGLNRWLGYAGLVAGVALTVLATVVGFSRADELRSTLALATREATPWSATDIDAVPSAGRVRRVAGIGARLAEVSGFSMLTPLSPLIPNSQAPARLGGVLLDLHVLRPLGLALDRQSRDRLAPMDDPLAWTGGAQEVDEWIAAWQGLADDPEEVDFRRLLSDAFGGKPDAWPTGLDAALAATSLRLPAPAHGGMDVDGLTDLARRNFITTMQRWADSVYANGPVATAARRAVDRSAGWRAQHGALSALRSALQDPGQAWITAAEDTPDHRYEMRVLGRALTLSLVGQATALSAKAAVSEIRIDARDAAEHFILPQIGPLLVRSSTGTRGGGGRPSLALAPGAQAWSAFLDRLASTGLADLPTTSPAVVAGPVTIDPATVSGMLSKLHTFDRLAMDLPGDLPAAVARDLLEQVVSELVAGVAASAELALRPAPDPVVTGDRAGRVARVAAALGDLDEVVGWLLAHEAEPEAGRVLAVRSSVAEHMLLAGTEVLAGEDPLGIYLDPAADANALVRRFGRGVERLRRTYERFGAPYVDAAAFGGAAVAYRWRDIGEDIARYNRGDAGAALSGLEGMLRAYAVDQRAACSAPRPALAAARDDYVARALDRFRTQVDSACASLDARQGERLYAGLEEYFGRNVAWMWPYANDASAPEMPSATLGEFVALLSEARDVLDHLDTPLGPGIPGVRRFLGPGPGRQRGAAVPDRLAHQARGGRTGREHHRLRIRGRRARRGWRLLLAIRNALGIARPAGEELAVSLRLPVGPRGPRARCARCGPGPTRHDRHQQRLAASGFQRPGERCVHPPHRGRGCRRRPPPVGGNGSDHRRFRGPVDAATVRRPPAGLRVSPSLAVTDRCPDAHGRRPWSHLHAEPHNPRTGSRAGSLRAGPALG